MKKLALVLATTLVSTPAMAGPYVNVETNANYTASNYESRSTDLHLGFEGDAGSLLTTSKAVELSMLLMVPILNQ